MQSACVTLCVCVRACAQLSVETVRPLIKPVLYIQGEDAKQLLGIILHRARARVFISPKDTVVIPPQPFLYFYNHGLILS